MTAPIPSSPTWPDLTLTQQTGQYDITAATSVLAHMAKVATKATQAEINSAAALKNPAYTPSIGGTMTEAFQTGQFHTGLTDRPATNPSVFVAADAPAQSAVDAEESVTQQLAAAAGDPKIGLVEADPQLVAREKVEEPKAEAKKAAPKKAEAEAEEYEEVDIDELTIPELKDILDEEEVEYPSTAKKADLVKLVEKTQK